MTHFWASQSNNVFLSNLKLLPLVLNVAMVVCAISLVFCLFRLLKGPTLADRMISLDASGITVMCLIVIYSLKQGTDLYFSAVLVIAILGFIGAVALAKYVQSGNIVDNKDILETAGSAIEGRYDPNQPKAVDRKELREETKEEVKEMVHNLNQDLKKDWHKMEEKHQQHVAEKKQQKEEE